MSDFDIDLGHAVLRSCKSAVCVDLESSATFAASEEDDIDQLRRGLTAKHSTDTKNERPWVHRADDFKLVLSVQTGDMLGTDALDELMEIVSSRLGQAKVHIM